ncbi:MAG: hypothetical protein QM537_03160 [Candidatus Symbiobacter sp.]|nr:hypothetical protein [Candidatus Symbiobacter sp.]
MTSRLTWLTGYFVDSYDFLRNKSEGNLTKLFRHMQITPIFILVCFILVLLVLVPDLAHADSPAAQHARLGGGILDQLRAYFRLIWRALTEVFS